MLPGVTSTAAVARAASAIAAREREVRAWVSLRLSEAAADAEELDRVVPGLLTGLTLGVKDIFDTADLPTGYGSPIYDGHRPRSDAAAVSLLRSAGAALIGKTVTAELAMYSPGPTRNPHRPDHTPGGSSSGSAAAVAAGMADIALGTQTAGSVIRPASFCGVWGFKPTYGTVPVAGVKLVAPSLDTVGWFAGSAALVEAVRLALTGRPPRPPVGRPPRLGLLWTDQRGHLDPGGEKAVLGAVARAKAAGAEVSEVAMPSALQGLADRVPLVQAYEACRSLHWEAHNRPRLLSSGLTRLLQWGSSITGLEYDRAVDRLDRGRRAAGLFDGVDAILTPGVTGEAPEGLASTGDPRFARLWNALGLPALSVPGQTGPSGLPIGVQLVGPAGSDDLLVGWGEWLGAALRDGSG